MILFMLIIEKINETKYMKYKCHTPQYGPRYNTGTGKMCDKLPKIHVYDTNIFISSQELKKIKIRTNELSMILFEIKGWWQCMRTGYESVYCHTPPPECATSAVSYCWRDKCSFEDKLRLTPRL